MNDELINATALADIDISVKICARLISKNKDAVVCQLLFSVNNNFIALLHDHCCRRAFQYAHVSR